MSFAADMTEYSNTERYIVLVEMVCINDDDGFDDDENYLYLHSRDKSFLATHHSSL